MSETDHNPLNYPFRSMTDFSDEMYHPSTGQELQPEPLGIGPTADVLVADGRVYAATETGLVILDAESLEILGRLGGLVSVRQISVNGALAVITARESGVYVIDVSDPTAPRLASHYDPVEFATGVHLASPQLGILTNRHYGLEFFDLTNPAKPRFLSSILVGEAQSVTSVGTIAYAGVWYEKELVLVDFSNPVRPEITGRSALDGFGDGVQVRDGLAYVVTGHHSALQHDPRTFEHSRHITLDMLDNGYGMGHGIEIHDVSDPTRPHCINRVKSAPAFCSPDTWRVLCHDNYLIQADSGSGVFVYDLARPQRPEPAAFAVLPAYDANRTPRTVSIQDDRHPVTGVAVTGKTLLIAGKTTDLYRCALPSLPVSEPIRPKTPYPTHYPDPDQAERVEGEDLLATDGQVHWVTTDGETLLVATGEDGFFVQDPISKQVIAHQRTKGHAQHVYCAKGLIYVSEVTGGLSVWKRDGSGLEQVGSWQPAGSVRQTLIPNDLPYGIAIAGPGEFVILDLADPENPREAISHQLIGHAYARLLAHELVDNTYAIGATQGSGLNWFDLSDASSITTTPPSSGARLCPITEGFTVHNGRALVVQAGGYYFASPDNPQVHGEIEHVREPNRYFSGNPQSIGLDRVAITNRATGSVRIIDVSDENAPKTLDYLQLPGNPDRPIRVGDHLVFPCGREGLRAIPCA